VANYYNGFSFSLINITDAEKQWLTTTNKVLTDLMMDGAAEQKDVESILCDYDIENIGSIPTVEFDKGGGHRAYIYSDESEGDVEIAAAWMAKFLELHRPHSTGIPISYACWCDKPRADAFSGGIALVVPGAYYFSCFDEVMDTLLARWETDKQEKAEAAMVTT